MNAPVATLEAPRAGFAPVTPIGDAPVLSLVPPAMQGDHVVYPEPVSTVGIEQQPLPTSAAVPVAPVRRRRPVTPLISLPMGASLAAALSVAPLMPGQALSAPQIQPMPSAYGFMPTTFPFMAAPSFTMAPPNFYGMMPQPMPMQTFVAYVTLMPVGMQTAPQMMGPVGWQAPQPPY
jgi:hypothetical protein